MRATKKQTKKSKRVPGEVRALLNQIATDPDALAQVVELVAKLASRSR